MGELVYVGRVGGVCLKEDMLSVLRLVPEVQRTVAELVGKDIDHVGMLLCHHIRSSQCQRA